MKRETITLTDPSDGWNFKPGYVLRSSDGRRYVVDDVDCGMLHFREPTRWERFKRWLVDTWRRIFTR